MWLYLSSKVWTSLKSEHLLAGPCKALFDFRVWVRVYANNSPHKDFISVMCVCFCVYLGEISTGFFLKLVNTIFVLPVYCERLQKVHYKLCC